ncbi:MAG: short-chain dehydrogenase/reductase [Bacteroidetes bacterium]|nr:short-chain dehydrogenase/reductase [Bacteroidota bacterium]
MESVKDKIVCITGASSGIGAACAEVFAREGSALILSARRGERLENVARTIRERYRVKVHSMCLDVTRQRDVENVFASLPEEWQAIDILVNNAGLSRGLDKIQEGKIQDWEEMIDTNVKGLLYVSRAVLPGMVQRNRGHVVNIGSIAGRQLYPGGNVYCASKFAVRALNQGMKMDLLGTQVRVSSVDPGLVETEFSEVRFHGDKERAKKVYADMRPLNGDDVAEAILFCATRPPHVNILEVVLVPTAQASVRDVHRTP